MTDDLPETRPPQPSPPVQAAQAPPPSPRPQRRQDLEQDDAVPLTIDEDLKVREPTSFSLRELLTKENA